VGGWNEIEIKANSAQLKLELGLSLAKYKKQSLQLFQPQSPQLSVLSEEKIPTCIITILRINWGVKVAALSSF
jgi:hypothetical protein